MGEDEPHEARPQWDNKAQFLLTCIGFAVGLGNVWRFPYQLQSNGGGAFLIPYFIMLVFEGVPLLYLELSVGQWMRQGSLGAWTKISPYMKGIGICSLFVSLLVGMYYNTIIAWCLWYLCNSFQEPLPWKSCPINANATGYVQECAKSSNTEYFWYRTTLNISPSIDQPGGIQVHLLATLILAWMIVALCVIKGIASSGKVVYFTATFPYVVLFCFLVRGLTLKGSGTGISYLFTPKVEVLSDPKIWLTASTQIFFSLSVAFGGMIAFSSYNPKDSDVELDTFIVSITNSATSILATVVIFAVLGFKATVDYENCVNSNIQTLLDQYDLPEGNITIDSYDQFIIDKNFNFINGTGPFGIEECSIEKNLDNGASGTGLAFIVFADAILEMPGSPFWAIIFFLMLLTLGLDSMFGNLEGVLTPLSDLGITKKIRSELSVGILVVFSFCISLVFILRSGNYWLDVFDKYAGSIPLLIIAFSELITVSWIYRYKRFNEELSNFLPPRNNILRKIVYWYWWATVPIISPLLLLAVFIYYLYDAVSSPNQYSAWQPDLGSNVDLLYPGFVVAVSVIITLLCTIWLPIGAAVEFVQSLLLSKRNPKVGADHLENGNHTEKNGKINGAFEEERSESNQGENFSSKEENAASSTSSRL